MTGVKDLIVFISVLFIIFLGLIYAIRSGNGRKTGKNRSYSFEDLKGLVSEMLNDYVSFAEKHPGMFMVNENTEAATRLVTKSIRECCSGAKGAREVCCEVIYDFLKFELMLTDEEVSRCTDLEDPVTMLYMLIMRLDKEKENYGFSILWDRFFKNRVKERREITVSDMREAFKVYGADITTDERMKLLSELLYIYTAGLGAIDILNWQKGCIEEIQLGLSGKGESIYDYRDELQGIIQEGKKAPSSKDSVHILVEGRPYRLSFITFGTEDEVIRILRNLIKNSVSPELTRKNPMIVTEAPDGRRISVSRPPFTDSWAGLIRKFDNVQRTAIEELICDEKAVKVLNEIALSDGNVAITGEMATGKTTLLRAMLLKTGEQKSIRVIESESFELNVREYLPDANSLTLRINDECTEDATLAFSKKTTGQVFVVGEVCSPEMANMVINISKTASKVLFTAHYRKTDDMIADFASARINAGHFSDEKAAYAEALRTVKYDVHLASRGGVRFVEYINEVVDNGRIKCLYAAFA